MGADGFQSMMVDNIWFTPSVKGRKVPWALSAPVRSQDNSFFSAWRNVSPSLSTVSPSWQMEFSLYLISHVGIIISLVCLVLAIATFLLCRAICNHNTYLHLHLCICLFLAKTLFIIGVDKTDNQVSHPLDCVLTQPHHVHICPCSSTQQLC